MSWESWIINEALRRTIPMGYTYIAFNALLKWSGCKDINMPDPCHFVRVHRWTASGSLWRADSSPAFFLPWHRQRQTFVQNFFIEDFAGLVWPVDVDLLSWIMLVAFVSVATVEEFIIGKVHPLLIRLPHRLRDRFRVPFSQILKAHSLSSPTFISSSGISKEQRWPIFLPEQNITAARNVLARGDVDTPCVYASYDLAPS
ncbi:hypothetical protein KXX33_006936 [Aspergillus fumigatus]|nr:hypothetical protein KXX30_007693 [Aspergillus fumigatus]KAH1367404.1 hypothetical protein KXX33_006936 [Aspergillus fumigatus]KAH1699687.1 hypothetical protein KXX12_005389 [Aspergillus fumigatus]KAH1953861.1 hypothetical protein KXV59_003799 [Aspergillus fumigatus]KAH2753170.1 hypothetical protein KXW10_004031 [Aspergillus fumigatus]